MIVSSDWRELDQVIGNGYRVVFTNGCFDPLRAHHVRLLAWSDRLAHEQNNGLLIVGVNDDASVRTNKGLGKPLFSLAERMEVLNAIRGVDFVVPFSDATPLQLIQKLKPYRIVKGGDYTTVQVVGHEHYPASIFPLQDTTTFEEMVRRYVAENLPIWLRLGS